MRVTPRSYAQSLKQNLDYPLDYPEGTRQKMASNINGIAVVSVGGGVILLWSAIQNKSILQTTQDLVSGKKPQPGPMGSPGGGGGGSGTGGATGPSAPSDPTGNAAIGKEMAAAMGWTGGEWDALYNLWTRESGWNNLAENGSSGAYGIPQSLPATKMPFAAQKAGGSHPRPQIAWGLAYIKGRYGKPSVALGHENQFGWY